MNWRRLVDALLVVAAIGWLLPGYAQVQRVYPEVTLTASQQTRYRSLLPGFRCMQCQNESLADSQAPLAKDMRYKIRQQLAAGKSNADITQYLVDRYGQYVLYKPRFEPLTYLLWIGPFVLLGVAAFSAWRFLRRTTDRQAQPLDHAALQKLLDEDP